jgi:hypothetical protein
VWQRSFAAILACPSILIHVTSWVTAESPLQTCPDIPDKLTLALAVCQDVSVVRITLGIDVNTLLYPTLEKRLIVAWKSGLVLSNSLQEVS